MSLGTVETKSSNLQMSATVFTFRVATAAAVAAGKHRPAWPALNPFFLCPERRWCRSRTALTMSSRPILSRDARFLAYTACSAGRASMKTVYSMWSSSVSPAVRIFAARSSILSIYPSGLVPSPILQLLRRRERSDLAPIA